MRGLGALPGVIALALSAACGDPPICQSAVFVAIQTSQITRADDGSTAGVQADITVKTSLAPGESVHLEVEDATGAITATHDGGVDAVGSVVFQAVAVTGPRTTLRASVDTSCGAAVDEQIVDVITDRPACTLVLSPAPAANPYYAPLGVLGSITDPDPGAPGYQATAVVTTRPGWTVELVHTTTAGDVILDESLAASDGTARFARTFADGLLVLRASCRGPGAAGAAALPVLALVDTTPPVCRFTRPLGGSTITPRFDDNGNLGDGVQLAVAALVTGDDVEGEPTTLTVTPIDPPITGTPQLAVTTPIDASGAMTAAATLLPATTPARFELALGAQDHAGNACTAVETYEVSFDACDLAVTAPAATVTRDANALAADGSQLDVTLVASPACAGRAVTSTCGLDAPGGELSPSGQLTLRPTICASSPCETTTTCSFRVTTASGLITQTVAAFTFDDQPPVVTVSLVEPAAVCGVHVTSASDVDAATPGVQLVLRVDAPGAVRTLLDVTSSVGATVFEVSGAKAITLVTGANQLVGSAFDAAGNRGRSPACTVTLGS
ncbi:MAG: hypothetical protein M3680_02550 [Myxococcota bacterium]|nr:hypothetical protein [Myxococcota bacterium]